MKFIIVFACLFALAMANEEAEVIKQFSEVNPEDFKYELELSNTIKAIQAGALHDKDNWIVNGEYEYVSKDGKHVKVEYTADATGYHPKVTTV